MYPYGAIIRACRKRAGLSQEKLAEMMGRTKSCISKYENNNKLMDMHTFLEWTRITRAQDVVIALLNGTDIQTIIQQIIQVSVVASISCLL